LFGILYVSLSNNKNNNFSSHLKPRFHVQIIHVNSFKRKFSLIWVVLCPIRAACVISPHTPSVCPVHCRVSRAPPAGGTAASQVLVFVWKLHVKRKEIWCYLIYYYII